MVLDDLPQDKRRGVFAVAGFAVAAALIVGFGAGSLSSPTGAFTESPASTDEIRETAQSIVEQQASAQEQRMALMANQSENISQEDLSFDAEVSDVSDSEFPSLYKVTVSISGTTVSQTGEVQDLDQEQKLYISKDGRYMFQQPTDLQAAQQPAPAPSGQ